MWNKHHLENLARTALHGRKLIVVSCRAPYVHEWKDGSIRCSSPAGGVTAALKPLLSAVGGVWIAQASGSADREAASPDGRVAVPPEDPQFSLRRLFIPAELQKGHYEGFSNQGLWPLCHNVFRRPTFRTSDWNAYRRVNQLFADAVLDEADGEPAVVFVQDYQFALLPQMLKAQNPSLAVAQFWHIPFPNVETARTCPWVEEILRGMLGNDVLGFHLPQHCSNFSALAESYLGARVGRAGTPIRVDGHSTEICDAPISIDFDAHCRRAASREVEHAMTEWRARIGIATTVGLGIDRLDYTKGIPERLRALAALFEREPQLRGKLTFVQIGVPSRSSIPEYAELDRSIEAEVAAINTRWGTSAWTPIILERRNLPATEMMALHRLAHFCMVTPLHDGMNLVAKEFVASRSDEDGVLILSRFAGAARELTSSLLVNPFSEADMVQALRSAVNMSNAERRNRMIAARSVVANNNVYRWAGSLLTELSRTAGFRMHSNSDMVYSSGLAASVA